MNPLAEHDPEWLIADPYCGRCERHATPMILPSSVAKALQNLLKHLDANVCCKTCGSVMSLEISK